VEDQGLVDRLSQTSHPFLLAVLDPEDICLQREGRKILTSLLVMKRSQQQVDQVRRDDKSMDKFLRVDNLRLRNPLSDQTRSD